MSFPVRERGLKLSCCLVFQMFCSSFPVRERGLKHPSRQPVPHIEESFPVRERGLKPAVWHQHIRSRRVVPRAGTWIETGGERQQQHQSFVVPRAGTWIETPCFQAFFRQLVASFPVRERGLKQFLN